MQNCFCLPKLRIFFVSVILIGNKPINFFMLNRHSFSKLFLTSLLGGFFLLAIYSFLPFKNHATDPIFTVVLDAGHGGKDPGNRGNGYYEKKIALNIVLKIGAELKKHPDVKVVYTRTKDHFVPLDSRASIANKAKADLFVSIHCDAHNSNAYGAGTFVLGLHENNRNFRIAQKENSVIFLEEDYEQKYDGFDPNNPESVISLVLMQEEYLDQSIEAAAVIQESFVKNLKRKDRTVKQAGFLVLRNTYMPSVLVETGFLTNKREGAYLNSSKGQQEIAVSIAKAILNYKDRLHQTISSDDNKILNNSEQIVTHNQPVSDIMFKIQIAASTKKVETTPFNFNGLNNVTVEKKGVLFRYYFGNTHSYNEAKKLQEIASQKGYSKSFVKAFKNGKEIKLSQALNSD